MVSAVHYGEMAYGNIGAGSRLDFTGIGRDVNLTSRLQELAKLTERRIVLSEDAARRVDTPLAELGAFQIRGFQRPRSVFGLADEVGV